MPPHLAPSLSVRPDAQPDSAALGSRSAHSDQPLPRIPGWTLVERIGTGTRTVVYSARPSSCAGTSPDDYAVKVLQPASASDPIGRLLMRREAVLGRRISNPHVVPVLACGLDATPCYVVMPRLQGATLSQLLRHALVLPLGRALWITRQIAEGLASIHAQGWLHGDVKPQNIVIGPDDHATLIDLGFARPIEQTFGRTSHPLMATVQYAAPESFVDTRGCDQRSDIYSLGAVLHELLTGHLPGSGNKLAAPLRNSHAPDCQVNLWQDVARMLTRMLAKEPLRRPTSGGELARELLRLEVDALAAAACATAAKVGSPE